MKRYCAPLILIVFWFFSCEKAPTYPSPRVPVDEVFLNVDLEDWLYSYEGEWYQWERDFITEELPIHIHYDFSTRRFSVYHLALIGDLSGEMIVISNGVCETTSTPEITNYDELWVKATYEVDDEFNVCLFDQNDWVEMTLVFW